MRCSFLSRAVFCGVLPFNTVFVYTHDLCIGLYKFSHNDLYYFCIFFIQASINFPRRYNRQQSDLHPGASFH